MTLKSLFQDKKWTRWLCELTGIALGLFLVFIPRTGQTHDRHWPQLVHSLYLSYGKFLFAVALSLIVLPSLLGINSIVKFLLDTKFFNWVAKVSFCGYLIHLTIMLTYIGNMKVDYYYTLPSLYPLFVSHTMSALVAGFIFSLIIEIPCTKLQKNLMKKLMRKSTK